MLPVLHVGPLAIQTPGLILLVGLWLGLSLAERYAHYREIESDQVYNLVFVVLITGLISGRLGYAALYPSAFFASPTSLISLNPGLFDPTSGAAAGFLAGIIYSRRKKLAGWGVLDAVTPILAVLQTAFSLANLASGDRYGSVTDLPWAVDLWGAYRHPTQIYTAILSLAILYLIWPGKRLAKQDTWGNQFLFFICMSSGMSLFFEAFRGDSPLLAGGFRAVQIGSWIILAICLWMLSKRNSLHENHKEDTI